MNAHMNALFKIWRARQPSVGMNFLNHDLPTQQLGNILHDVWDNTPPKRSSVRARALLLLLFPMLLFASGGCGATQQAPLYTAAQPLKGTSAQTQDVNSKDVISQDAQAAQAIHASESLTTTTTGMGTQDAWNLSSTRWNGAMLQLKGPDGKGNPVKNARTADFHPDGHLLYVVGRSTENIATYKLEDPWNLASGRYQTSFDLSGTIGTRNQQSVAHGLWFRKDTGQTFYVFNRTEIFRFDMEVAWDLTSASLAGYADLSSVVKRGHDIDVHPGGQFLYIDDRQASAVHQFRFDTPWSLESLVYEGSLDVSDEEKAVRGIEFKRDGTIFYLMDTSRRALLEYEAEVPWRVLGAEFRGRFDVSGQSGNPRSVTWKPDGRCFYVTDTSDGVMYQYEAGEGCS